MAQRTTYQQQLDKERLSPEKAEQTLKVLLEENTKRNEKRVKRAARTKRPAWTRYAPALAAVAAAVVLMVTLLPGQKQAGTANVGAGDSVVYGEVRLNGLPPFGGGRGSAAGTLEDVFGVTAGELFKDWTVERSAAYTAENGKQAILYLSRGENELRATVSDFEPALRTALQETKESLTGVKFNRDPDSGFLDAVYQKGGYFITLHAEKIESAAFEEIVKELYR